MLLFLQAGTAPADSIWHFEANHHFHKLPPAFSLSDGQSLLSPVSIWFNPVSSTKEGKDMYMCRLLYKRTCALLRKILIRICDNGHICSRTRGNKDKINYCTLFVKRDILKFKVMTLQSLERKMALLFIGLQNYSKRFLKAWIFLHR